MKNTKRKVTTKTKWEVYYRDNGRCVLCGNGGNLERNPHHIFFGNEAQYDKSRNDANKLVVICVSCHWMIHFGGQAESREKRDACKKYLEDMSSSK